MKLRHFLSWKSLFYDALLPTLRAIGPRHGDALLGRVGQAVASWPARRRALATPLARLLEQQGQLDALPTTLQALAANVPRFLARDCQLDGLTDDAFQARFDVEGYEHLEAARNQGRGVILVGCHLGAHLSAGHWLYRRGAPLRMLVQRPQHMSRLVARQFAITDGPHPQAGFFVRRHLTPEEASKRIFRTRTALRDGLIVYLMGDVPWTGPNTRPGRLLGHEQTFQSLWADFAALFRAPVVAVFCTHRPAGRYLLQFDPLGTVPRGSEDEAVRRYLARLDAEIACHPADAVAHLLWPCYNPRSATRRPESTRHAA